MHISNPKTQVMTSIRHHVSRYVALSNWVALLVLLAGLKIRVLRFVPRDPVFGVYGLLAALYLWSRILTLLLYHAPKEREYRPFVTVVIPTMNEEKAIYRTIEACCALDYPRDRLEILVINDGSTDRTWSEITRAMRDYPQVRAVNWTKNRGKRAGMAEGVRRSNADIIVFIDSDSVVEADSLKPLVQPFVDPNVAGVVGHVDVLNKDTNLLTKMQAVRYFVSFSIIKASESAFNSVTCCSGCYSAYRRAAVLQVLKEWEEQRFLGKPCTFGDDRSLTNLLLREGYSLRYAANARVKTIVPDTWRGYLRQQLRWKKSWFRETLIAIRHMWRRTPATSVPYYLSVLSTFFSPLVLVHSFVGYPAARASYLAGLAALGLIYGLYYRARREDGLWLHAFTFVFLNAFVFSWQIFQAILTSTNTSWGTRQGAQTPGKTWRAQIPPFCPSGSKARLGVAARRRGL